MLRNRTVFRRRVKRGGKEERRREEGARNKRKNEVKTVFERIEIFGTIPVVVSFKRKKKSKILSKNLRQIVASYLTIFKLHLINYLNHSMHFYYSVYLTLLTACSKKKKYSFVINKKKKKKNSIYYMEHNVEWIYIYIYINIYIYIYIYMCVCVCVCVWVDVCWKDRFDVNLTVS